MHWIFFQTFTPNIFNRLVGKRSRSKVKKSFGTLQFIWKLNLRQICADSWMRFLSLRLPQKFLLWQLHELDYSAGSRYVYRVSSHVFGRRQATLHSFSSSYVNFASSWFVEIAASSTSFKKHNTALALAEVKEHGKQKEDWNIEEDSMLTSM